MPKSVETTWWKVFIPWNTLIWKESPLTLETKKWLNDLEKPEKSKFVTTDNLIQQAPHTWCPNLLVQIGFNSITNVGFLHQGRKLGGDERFQWSVFGHLPHTNWIRKFVRSMTISRSCKIPFLDKLFYNLGTPFANEWLIIFVFPKGLHVYP